MRIVRPQGGFGGPDRGPYWHGSSRPRLGFLYNLCTTISSCFYVFCCCWLIEDCFMGRRSLLGPEPPPPPPPQVGPSSHGLLGTMFGQPGPPTQSGPVGYPEPEEPPPFMY